VITVNENKYLKMRYKKTSELFKIIELIKGNICIFFLYFEKLIYFQK